MTNKTGGDAEVKLWDCPFPLRRRKIRKSRSRRRKIQSTPTKIGNLRIHSNQIRHLLKIDETTFATGGFDGLICIWKDGRVESEKRDEEAMEYYQNSV